MTLLDCRVFYSLQPLPCLALLLAPTGQFFDEARFFTRVDISAVRWDTKTSAQGGCGTNGCTPDLVYVRLLYPTY